MKIFMILTIHYSYMSFGVINLSSLGCVFDVPTFVPFDEVELFT